MKTISFLFFMALAMVLRGQTFPIPSTAIVIKDTLTTLTGSNTYWLCPGAAVTKSGAGSATIFMEDTSYYRMVNSGSNNVYVKSAAEFCAVGGGGENKIYYETGAVITDSLTGGWGNAFIECQDLVFDYYDAPKDGCFEHLSITSVPLEKIAVYPNPVVDVLHVRAGGKQVSLYSCTGELLEQRSQDIDMRHYPSGVYLVLVDGAGVKILKR